MAEAKKSGMGKFIQGRWLDINKGDKDRPDDRSRFVGKEFNTGSNPELFAATPPLEALKLILGHAASRKAEGAHVMMSDVKRAYFHAKAKREIYVQLPREDPMWAPDLVGRLNLALYGTRDAAALWQECVAEHLVSIGFTRGRSNLCVFYNKNKGLRTLVHGDDYLTAGTLNALKWLQQQLEAKFEMKTVVVGHSGAPEVVTEGKMLNRVVRATPSGWEYEIPAPCRDCG